MILRTKGRTENPTETYKRPSRENNMGEHETTLFKIALEEEIPKKASP